MKSTIKTYLSFIVSASLMILSTSSITLAKGKPPGERGKPPQEAIEACAEKQEGDSVSFETRRGDNLEATCEYIDEQLVAVPIDHEQRRKPK